MIVKIISVDHTHERVTLQVLGSTQDIHKNKRMELREPKRTNSQNNYLFGLARWAIENGLKGSGHFSPEGLIEDYKAFKGIKHSSDLDVQEMSAFVIDFETFLMDFFGLDLVKWREFIKEDQ